MAAPLSIYEVAAEFRSALSRREEAALSAIVEAYRRAFVVAETELERYQRAPSSPAVLFQRRRVASIVRALESEARHWLAIAGATVAAEAGAARGLGERYAGLVTSRELLVGGARGLLVAETGALSVGETAGTAALRALAGFLQPGSPLAQLFSDLGEEFTRTARAALERGLALGLHPRQLRRELAEALGGNLARGLTIARTEVLRAYREGTREAWRRRDFVQAWEWQSARDARACAICWVMDGREFALDEPMATHPNCRCTMLPVLPSLSEIAKAYGIPEVISEPVPSSEGARRLGLRPRVGSAREAFWELPPQTQRAILGPTRHEALRTGRIDWGDLVGVPPVGGAWGRVPYLRTLKSLGLDRRPAPTPSSPPSTPPSVFVGEPTPRPARGLPAGDPAYNYLALGLPNITAGSSFAAKLEAFADARQFAKDEIARTIGDRLYVRDEVIEALARWDGSFEGYRRRLIPATGEYYFYTLDKSWEAMTTAERLATLWGPDGPEILREFTSRLVQTWAMTSADLNPLSLLVQIRAASRYGMSGADIGHLEAKGESYQAAKNAPPELVELVDAFLDESYRWTQARFEQLGMRTIRLFRGLGYDEAPRGLVGLATGGTRQVELAQQPLSSWTASIDTARSFARSSGVYGYVLSAEFPVSWVMATARTGFGCLDEQEFVLASPRPFRVIAERVI